mgnify:FL=1
MMPAQQKKGTVSLGYLLDGWVTIEQDFWVGAPTVDARNIEQDGVFLAVVGAQLHGLEHAMQAVERNASVIIYDPAEGGNLLAARLKKQIDIPLLALTRLSEKLSEFAARFYAYPSRELSVIGITGTNGKTSVSHFIAQALNVSHRCGVIGTLGWGELNDLQKTINTTPDAISVQAQLATVLSQGCSALAMEVSSHGLDQQRVKAVEFSAAVFTNLSHDHLDYHQTMTAYGEAKLALFKMPSLKFVVLNEDDSFSENIVSVLPPRVEQYGFTRQIGQLKAQTVVISNQHLSEQGVSFDVKYQGQQAHISSALFGVFNVDNLAATLTTLLAMGDSLDEATIKLKQVSSVAGRMQLLTEHIGQPSVIIDYAHTPEALKLALSSLREHCKGQLKLVFGCGGNRDQAKRPLMGDIASKLADQVIVTNDNPRFENGELIAEQIKAGAKGPASLSIELDRAKAIQQLVASSTSDDIILVAGKGHEDYQQIADQKIPFNDAKQILSALDRQFEKATKLGAKL